MASSLQRLASHSRVAYRFTITPFSRAFSTEDALVEIKPGEVGLVSGIPEEHLRRKVLIYSPARTASQQGSGKVGRWKINFMSTQKWENPEEAAIAFAKKHGWDYKVKKRQTPLLKAKSYADNFKWKGPPKEN
ncbi:unnamed protein product [Fraxinus pennsylvanica]|uniref:NADH dehydrogenase [ubiquinone] iron-sulfur protein 4, mitochondrial n=1 Tax=Fraxinus pennsylvanica TaxID=56036 RepID=A0AAD1YWM4_9LAMI|nr:unnamed protein product [Fraxinus pennsylvanica]